VVDTGTFDAAGQVEFEVEPEFVGGVLEFVADEVGRGQRAVAGFDDEVFDEIGAGEWIEFTARSLLEGDFLAGEFT
jgi:hypothetical protein